MDLHKKLPLIDIENNDDYVKFLFIDKRVNEVYEVIFRKKQYDTTTSSYVESDEKLAQVEEWCKEYFNLPLNKIEKAVGQKHDVYAYDGYNSLWESDKKFSSDMVGQIIQATIKEITVNSNGIKIRYDYNDNTYASNMGFTQKVGDDFYVNPQKKLKQLQRFMDKFHVPVEESEKLKGKNIMVEIKKAMGKYVYGDIKALPQM